MNYYLGIDFGTSGARAVVIDENKTIKAEVEQEFEIVPPEFWAGMWEKTLFNLIAQLPYELRCQIKAIAINGTSSTVMLCDERGNIVNTPLLYNDGRGVGVLERLKAIAPTNNIVLSATSSLAKLLWMSEQPFFNQGRYLLHQADYLAYLLHGKLGISDYHNALKLGYDVEKLAYPTWLTDLPIMPLLPQVLAPGTPMGEITAALGLPNDCVVCAGTTDSIAAFLASGAKQPGEAVTSLGSTLVLKLLSRTRIDNAEFGIYSHRLGDLWLTGGASNTGGAVLKHFFTDAELASLSSQIEASTSNLNYYPLLKMGDRFPINDPLLPPRLEPRPDSDVEFLHGLLESMARIESRGYELLQQLGADKLACVYTAGGGAKNSVWTKIRGLYLQVPMLLPIHTAAAYGTALLAMQSIKTR
jgi:D-ribulokinase